MLTWDILIRVQCLEFQPFAHLLEVNATCNSYAKLPSCVRGLARI